MKTINDLELEIKEALKYFEDSRIDENRTAIIMIADGICKKAKLDGLITDFRNAITLNSNTLETFVDIPEHNSNKFVLDEYKIKTFEK